MSTAPLHLTIIRVDESKRVFKALVMRPNRLDRHNTWATRETIENAAHQYMAWYGLGDAIVDFMHRDATDWRARFPLVESYITDVELRFPRTGRLLLDGETGEGEIVVPAGSWIAAVKVLDDVIWQMILDGVVKGFSLWGHADLTPKEIPT